ncbi:hypothetical protein [Streptomyces sp. NPDC056660]|uniref:hypothetical protein n=1 Tax=Streptomyces sp. NPDC056660 TaxID=3345897 RepID=UPI0036A32A8C
MLTGRLENSSRWTALIAGYVGVGGGRCGQCRRLPCGLRCAGSGLVGGSLEVGFLGEDHHGDLLPAEERAQGQAALRRPELGLLTGYTQLTAGRGWSTDTYEEWLAGTLIATFLRPARPKR